MENKNFSKIDNKFNLFSAFFAFIIWGSWAYYINDSSVLSKITSGLAQGFSSFTIVLILIYLVTWAYNRLPKKLIFFPLPSILVVLTTGSSLFLIHFLVQTPRIFYTILPSTTMSFIFCLLITAKLKRQTRNKLTKKIS